ncbi:hypothetical protein KGP36_04075 [Patescibacteria group bacterium]|nr:hypothetical protein [Patescibacteria group bacterium]
MTFPAVSGGGLQTRAANSGEPLLFAQGAETAYTDVATLKAADLMAGIITFNNGAGKNLTLPLATDLDAALTNAQNANIAFDFFVIGLGAGTATVVTNTGWTTTGALTTAQNTATHYRVRRTGTAAYTLYRIAG